MPNADNNKDSGLDFDTDDFAFVSTQATTTTLNDPVSPPRQQRRKISLKASQTQRQYQNCIRRLVTNEGCRLLLVYKHKDLNQPVLLLFDNSLLVNFNNALDSDIITICDIYNKRQFEQNLQEFIIENATYTNVCKVCRSKSRKGANTKKQGAPLLMSTSNKIDPSCLNYRLDKPTIVKEMLIARIYIQVECF